VIKWIAGDRNAWRLFMEALCSTRSKGTWWWWWWWWKRNTMYELCP
jgi:hypothetical protein